MHTKRWTLDLTPSDAPARARTGLSRDEAGKAINDLLYGDDRLWAQVAAPAPAPASAEPERRAA